MGVEPTTSRTAATDDDKDLRLYRNDHNSLSVTTFGVEPTTFRTAATDDDKDFCAYTETTSTAYNVQIYTHIPICHNISYIIKQNWKILDIIVALFVVM